MPVLIAFWVLLGISAITDHHPRHYPKDKSASIQYEAWSAPMWDAIADKTGHCNLAFFVVVTQQRKMRLVVGGYEKGTDWSWTFYHTTTQNNRVEATFQFFDPITGKLEAERLVGVNCWPHIDVPYNAALYKPDGTLRGFE